VIAKLIGFGVAALVVSGLAATTIVLWLRPRAIPPPQKATSSFARELERAARDAGDAPVSAWAVTKAQSAHHMLVIEVEAERLDDAGKIAVEIVEPMLPRGYEEVLVYVRHVNPAVDPTVRRIQWTLAGGFVETSYSDR
jgi:hypothetical protein